MSVTLLWALVAGCSGLLSLKQCYHSPSASWASRGSEDAALILTLHGDLVERGSACSDGTLGA